MPLLAAVHQLVDVGGVGDLGALRDLPIQGGGEVAQDLDLEEAGVAGAEKSAENKDNLFNKKLF